jgi:CheY-like chemotaxis protein
MAGFRVLIIDDDALVLTTLQRYLQRDAFVVQTALSGPLGLAQLEAFDPHVVICDYRMPGMDGREALKQVALRKPQAVRVLLTGQDDELSGEVVWHLRELKPWAATLAADMRRLAHVHFPGA